MYPFSPQTKLPGPAREGRTSAAGPGSAQTSDLCPTFLCRKGLGFRFVSLRPLIFDLSRFRFVFLNRKGLGGWGTPRQGQARHPHFPPHPPRIARRRPVGPKRAPSVPQNSRAIREPGVAQWAYQNIRGWKCVHVAMNFESTPKVVGGLMNDVTLNPPK